MARIEKELTAVDVAKDVLKHLASKKIKAQAGKYVTFKEDLSQRLRLNWGGKQLQRAFRRMKGFKCQTCALGACFIAVVDRKNDMPVRSHGYGFADMRLKLYGIFGQRQLAEIESAFERQSMSFNYGDAVWSDCARAGEWGKRFSTDHARLRAIMKNIIKNDGVFVVPRPEPVASTPVTQ